MGIPIEITTVDYRRRRGTSAPRTKDELGGPVCIDTADEYWSIMNACRRECIHGKRRAIGAYGRMGDRSPDFMHVMPRCTGLWRASLHTLGSDFDRRLFDGW